MLNIWKNQPKTDATRYIIQQIVSKIDKQKHIEQRQPLKKQLQTSQPLKRQPLNRQPLNRQLYAIQEGDDESKEGGKYKLIRKYKNLR
jgi:hypothetical protein